MKKTPKVRQKSLHKEISKMKGMTILLITLVAAAISMPAAATCEPGGPSFYGYYDHIANGWPEENACWEPYRMAFVTTNSCHTTYAYQFGYSGSISQTISISSDATATGFEFVYYLDFIDPNDDGANNKLFVTIRDLTTGATLASDSYGGYFPDLVCSQRILRFSGNFAGHTLRVIFSGTAGYSNTKIRVRRIFLWQYRH